MQSSEPHDKPGLHQDSALVALNQFSVVMTRFMCLIFFCLFHNINSLAERNLECLCEGRTIGALYDCICTNRIHGHCLRPVPIVKASLLKLMPSEHGRAPGGLLTGISKDPFTVSGTISTHTVLQSSRRPGAYHLMGSC